MFPEILHQDILTGGSNAAWFLELGYRFVRDPQKLLHILEMEILHSDCKDRIVADLLADLLSAVGKGVKVTPPAVVTETERRRDLVKLRMS